MVVLSHAISLLSLLMNCKGAWPLVSSPIILAMFAVGMDGRSGLVGSRSALWAVGYLSSLASGTLGTWLSARRIARKDETPVQNKTAMSAWWGIWKPYATLLSFGLIPKAGIATELLRRSVPSKRQWHDLALRCP
jgi:hypothetical protein